MIDGFNLSRIESYGCEESKGWKGESSVQIYGLSFTQKNQSLMASYTKNTLGK